MITKCYFAIVVCSFFSSFLIGCENPTFRPYKGPHGEEIVYTRIGPAADTGYAQYAVLISGGQPADTLPADSTICIKCYYGDTVKVKVGYTTSGAGLAATVWEIVAVGKCGWSDQKSGEVDAENRYSVSLYDHGCR